MRKIYFADTTLRDGEQTPGVALRALDKLRISERLAALGVDVIEAGFPASSQGDFKAVAEIAEKLSGVTVSALARALKADIDAAAAALAKAEKPRLHIFIATSDVHIKYKLKTTREEVLNQTREMVAYAASLCREVQFSPEDASRSDRQFLYSVLEAAIESGASIINIPDTVGYAVPEEFGSLIKDIKEKVRGIEKTRLSVHCHNDLGLATANTLAAIENGASQVECTINGMGERAGNAALEEIVMALKTREKYYGCCNAVKTEKITSVSKFVASVTGIPVPVIKSVVGQNAFAHESGIHQHGVMAERSTYEIMTPQSVGLKTNSIVLGKLSGRHAFEEKASELGYQLDKNIMENAFTIFKSLSDKKNQINDDDVSAIIEQALDEYNITDGYELDSFQIQSGNKMKSTAMISIIKNGKTIAEAALGDGPVEAAFNAVNRIADKEYKLKSYKIMAVTEGRDALGEVSVKITDGNNEYSGRGVSTDIIASSIKAYINAINRSNLYSKSENT